MSTFAQILEFIPDEWESLSPVPFKDLMSYPARIAVTYEEPLVYLLMAIWCIARASDSVSGELGRGTMEILLSQPLSRLQAWFTPTLVTLVGVILLTLSVWGGSCAGIATTTVERPWMKARRLADLSIVGQDVAPHVADDSRIPMREEAPFHLFAPAALNYFCLGFFLCGVCSLLSAVDRYRWRTIGVMVGFYVTQMVFEVLGQALESVSWLRCLTFLRAYEPVVFVSKSLKNPDFAWNWFETDAAGRWVDLGPLAGDAILLGLGGVTLITAAVIFCRRDLPAPL